jgi:ketosteroid isomerase-like protein
MRPMSDRAHEEDVARIRAWFEGLARCVRDVDFRRGRALFAPDMVAFGTFTDFMHGRDAVEREQWRSVWQHIDGFRFRLDGMEAIVSADRLTAVGMAVFDSTGYRQDGTPYDRPGRTTVALARAAIDEDWVARHTHMSLFRDVPTRSYRDKPEAAAD